MERNCENFKKKCRLFEKMGDEYRRAVILTSDSYVSYCNGNKVNESDTHYDLPESENIKYYENLKKVYDLILGTLRPAYDFILKRDFFELDDVGWWQYFYSRSTYYRIKNKAMDLFLEALNSKKYLMIEKKEK